jgi:hypothetical protein
MTLVCFREFPCSNFDVVDHPERIFADLLPRLGLTEDEGTSH